MQRHQMRKATFQSGLMFSAILALGSVALAGEPLPDRPGFGYTIQFTSGSNTAATPQARAPEAVVVRPGFGYTINFVPSDPADSLFPPGWAKRRAASQEPNG